MTCRNCIFCELIFPSAFNLGKVRELGVFNHVLSQHKLLELTSQSCKRYRSVRLVSSVGKTEQVQKLLLISNGSMGGDSMC